MPFLGSKSRRQWEVRHNKPSVPLTAALDFFQQTILEDISKEILKISRTGAVLHAPSRYDFLQDAVDSRSFHDVMAPGVLSNGTCSDSTILPVAWKPLDDECWPCTVGGRLGACLESAPFHLCNARTVYHPPLTIDQNLNRLIKTRSQAEISVRLMPFNYCCLHAVRDGRLLCMRKKTTSTTGFMLRRDNSRQSPRIIRTPMNSIGICSSGDIRQYPACRKTPACDSSA